MLQFQYHAHIAGAVVIFIETCGKWAISEGKRGAIHAKSIPSSRQKFLDTPVYAAVPSDRITPTLLQHPHLLLPLLSPPPEPPLNVPGASDGSPIHQGEWGKVERREGARDPELHLPAAVIGAKTRRFHGSKQGPVM